MAGRIAVGVIRKPHGVRGEASVELWTDSLERLQELTDVQLVSPDEKSVRPVRIEAARGHVDRALVRFEGFDSPEALREVQNWTIEIPEEDARELGEDEYFLHDLVGLTLVDAGGNVRGVVRDTQEGGGGLLLSVEGPKGTFEVPFASEICTEIDLGAKRIVVNLPEGLDELDHVED
ncbi:MAG TPA: ribosome maturation factor RimM [Thermoanaerobaculia bacterium]|nr:ribosome maturation factor RimM [Thermoanaerobaculia bacterium]